MYHTGRYGNRSGSVLALEYNPSDHQYHTTTMKREHRARLTYFRDMLSALTVAPGAILPVDVRRPFRPATVYVDNIARWHGPPSGAAAPDGGASTDDGSCGSDSTMGSPPLMDASDTSSDEDNDDSSGWDSLFSGCTDVSPDGPGLCGQPFGHSSHQLPALIDVSVRPARREGVPTHGMRHGAD